MPVSKTGHDGGFAVRAPQESSSANAETTLDRCSILISEISKSVMDLSESADIACGPEGEPGKAAMAGVPCGTFARIEQALEGLRDRVEHLVGRFRPHLS